MDYGGKEEDAREKRIREAQVQCGSTGAQLR